MAFRPLHPVAINQLSITNTNFQNPNSLRILRNSWFHLPLAKYLTILVWIAATGLSTAQETSGFKPVNGDTGNSGKTSPAGEDSEKPTEFITFNNNPNQRNLLQPSNPNSNNNNSDSSPQPYQDYYTRGLPNYLGGSNSIPGNSLNGLFPSNIDPFAHNGNQGGLPFPHGFPPSFPFQGLGGAILSGGGGGGGPVETGPNQGPLSGGGGFAKPPLFPNQAIPPQFQFNRPPPNPNHAGGIYPNSPFPVQGYPAPSTYPVGNGQGISNLYLGLPRQIKVPGRIVPTLLGKDAEITCEFPRFLILIQV